MQQQRTSELFALFFDPRVPVLFILGSIVLAILGNGAYALLVRLLGETTQSIVAIMGGALLILIFVTIGFRALIRIIARRQPDITVVPPEETADPHAGLILSVGPSPTAADRDIITWHMRNHTLRHCWMIVSPDVEKSQKYRDIEFWLRTENVHPHALPIQNPTQADLSYEAVKTGVLQARELLDDASIIVDITGGIKLMTTGAVLACRDYGIAVQYWDSQRDENGNPIPGTARPRKVSLRNALQEEAT